jgi:hypothetical protein
LNSGPDRHRLERPAGACRVARGCGQRRTIPDPIDGGNLVTGFFAEASINLTAAGVPAWRAASPDLRQDPVLDVVLRGIKDSSPTPSINNCGTIIIKKVTIPSPDASNTSFPMTLTGGPSAFNDMFSLADKGSFTQGSVKQGNGYVAAETVPNGWVQTGASCDDGSPVTNIDVSALETVTCTFTNTAQAT